MERLQTGQDRSSTSKVIRLNTVPAGQRYAMVMPSYLSSLSMFNAKRPPPHHHDMQEKTILAFRRIVHNFCTPHASLTPTRGGTTPAMAAGITDHCWTVQELLSFHVPPPRWIPPKQRGRPSHALKRLVV